jgi:hypothetical protein
VKPGNKARGAIRAGGWAIGGHQLDLLHDLISALVGFYYSYFLWPPEEMRKSARLLEPHLDTLAELARRLEMWVELGNLLHRRAIFVSWEGKELDRALRYARESVTAFRKSNSGKPHRGTLALFLTQLAELLVRTGSNEKARDTLLEAEENVVGQVGSDALETFLVYCQLLPVARAVKDHETASRAEQEATEIAAELAGGSPRREAELLEQLKHPRPWAHWFLHQYVGL